MSGARPEQIWASSCCSTGREKAGNIGLSAQPASFQLSEAYPQPLIPHDSSQVTHFLLSFP